MAQRGSGGENAAEEGATKQQFLHRVRSQTRSLSQKIG
ncbi:hypothetical protein GEOBRER4_n3061 [Citrifermentans bremense]|uniref:Uncharacterized protein n=1 Tax=Citrifermentans bremense TaxID=60035 RepID=A0A7R7FSH0_9BACT|nr:hypothetical protein GEOBRER4_n3061 [Citrifermentans bremense]